MDSTKLKNPLFYEDWHNVILKQLVTKVRYQLHETYLEIDIAMLLFGITLFITSCDTEIATA